MRDSLLTVAFVPLFVVAFLVMTPAMIASDFTKKYPLAALSIFAVLLAIK